MSETGRIKRTRWIFTLVLKVEQKKLKKIYKKEIFRYLYPNYTWKLYYVVFSLEVVLGIIRKSNQDIVISVVYVVISEVLYKKKMKKKKRKRKKNI